MLILPTGSHFTYRVSNSLLAIAAHGKKSMPVER